MTTVRPTAVAAATIAPETTYKTRTIHPTGSRKALKSHGTALLLSRVARPIQSVTHKSPSVIAVADARLERTFGTKPGLSWPRPDDVCSAWVRKWRSLRVRGDAVTEPPVTFAAYLRELRTRTGLTQEELAAAAGLSPRSVSDLERGINLTARKDTARLLAGALQLTGTARAEFEAVARGRAATAVTKTGTAKTGTAKAGGAQESGPGTGGVAAAMRTLPRDIGSFTGRRRELEKLVDAAVRATEAGRVVGIHAIGGMAGVGKTAFAVHAAHRLADQFPGGQIFLPLHGHTPGQQPVDPADALASLLLTLGVPPPQIPPGLEARMALWRDRVAERQLLLILDDAASSEQVLPLLPGSGGSLVLVTSRRHLSALEDATAISLDTLPADEARALLARLAGRPGLDADDAAA